MCEILGAFGGIYPGHDQAEGREGGLMRKTGFWLNTTSKLLPTGLHLF